MQKSELKKKLGADAEMCAIQRTVRTAHLSVLMIMQNCRIQYSTEQF